MRNNKGLGRFETIIVILLLLVIFAFLFKVILDGAGQKNFTAMREDAVNFGKAVSVNANFFHDSGKVSLGEAIAEKTIKQIKNPVGKGYCDETESKVTHDGEKYLVTLRCGDYLIESTALTSLDNAPVYEVGSWKEEKTEGADSTTLYNCEDAGKEVYPEYYDELYFVYKINQDYGANIYGASGANQVCKLLQKEVYRDKKKIDE